MDERMDGWVDKQINGGIQSLVPSFVHTFNAFLLQLYISLPNVYPRVSPPQRQKTAGAIAMKDGRKNRRREERTDGRMDRR